MLWINLIADVLGAIAIGTEPYNQDSSKQKQERISMAHKIVLPEMWRQILGHSLYQIVVLVIMMYFGNLIFFEDSFNLVTSPERDALG
jgi:Ca2+ transporting ATPase